MKGYREIFRRYILAEDMLVRTGPVWINSGFVDMFTEGWGGGGGWGWGWGWEGKLGVGV